MIDDCHAGQITIDYQPGHPHGFVSSIYIGEVAFGLPLHDPDGVLDRLLDGIEQELSQWYGDRRLAV